MSNFDNEAMDIYFDIDKTAFERRADFQRLLKENNVHREYMDATSSFIKRTRAVKTATEAEAVAEEVVNGDEMQIIEKMILAILLFLLYGNGPKNYLVPSSYLPTPAENHTYK